MKCSKCGTEYEGESCPECNGPEIIFNKSDYIRRRKEYEETGIVEGIKFKKPGEEEEKPEEEEEFHIPIPQIKLPELKVSRPSLESLSAHKEKIGSSKVLSFFKKHWIKCCIILAVLIIGGFSATKIVQLVKRQSMTLYITADDRIYTAGNLDTTFVDEKSSVVFTKDQKKFYDTTIPDEVQADPLVESVASADGKYFAAVTCSDDEIYRFYVWNEDGVTKVSESSAQKSIMYISDKGKVLYTQMNYSYESVVDNITLYLFDCSGGKQPADGTNTTIANNVRSEALYLKNKTLLYLDTSNKLYSLDLDKLTDKQQLLSDVTEIYGVSQDDDTKFQNSTESVIDESSPETFIYNQNSKFYYYDLGDQTSTYLFTSNMSGVEVTYEKKDGYLYCTIANTVYYGKVSDSDTTTLTKLDQIRNSTDTCYISASSTLLYVNRDGDLVSVDKGTAKVIRSGVTAGTLNKVRNTDNAITYVADGVQYYRSSLSAQEVTLQEVSDTLDTSGTILHKGYLYFVNDKSELCSCNKKGKEFNVLGAVETFWVH